VQGQQFLALDIGLPVDQLGQPIRAALTADDGATELRVAAVNRRGRAIDANVRISPLHGDGQSPNGVIVLVDG